MKAAPSETDDMLIARYAAGDQSAARELTSRHAELLYRLAFRRLQDAAEAEDVAQEAMLRLWRRAADWEPGGAKLSTWLFRVAENLCIDRLRKRRTSPLDDAPEIADDRAGADEQISASQSVAMLYAAIDALPDRQGEALRMRHLDEMGNEDIADALSISVEAVESLLARGRRALRTRLTPQRAAIFG